MKCLEQCLKIVIADDKHNYLFSEEEVRKVSRLEKVSEVSENTEDDCCDKSLESKMAAAGPARQPDDDMTEKTTSSATLARKDSFHQGRKLLSCSHGQQLSQ